MKKVFGYARVSTHEQNPQLQIDALQKAGCDEIFSDTFTGKHDKRPEYQRMMSMLREGDTVVVWKWDRISRSLRDLINLAEDFQRRGIEFKSIMEQYDTNTAQGKLFFHMMAALAQFERELTVERVRAGIASARARGRKGGRPRKDKNKLQMALLLYDRKDLTIAQIQELTGVSSSTLYRALRTRIQ